MPRSTARRLTLLALLPLAGCAVGESGTPPAAAVPLYEDLGTHHYEITTDVPLTQRYFDQGLRLYYAFNHAEAIRAFDEAARLDPDCAMCPWGSALAYGPNINMPMDSAAGAAAYDALTRAMELRQNASPGERDLIEALAERYSPVPTGDRAALDSAYARSMADLARRYPGDAEITTLSAEALMDLSPWQYWNHDGSPRPDTPRLLAALERVLDSRPDHPGANHLFIHAVEAVDPQRAVPMAERLAGLMPGAGHIVHMPGHIYVRVGRYSDAIRANEHAVHADETFIQDQKPAFGVYTAGYYPHNYDFLAFASSMIGRSAQAIGAAERMAALVPGDLLHAPGMTVLQSFISRPLQMRVRFERWEEILEASRPADGLPYALAMWHYARGRALAARGDDHAAGEELGAVERVASDPGLVGVRLEFNTVPSILGIAREVLAGHVAAARGDETGAIRHLEEAVRLEDALVYGEPPEWSIPVRQELGALLMEAGRVREAEAVYREELERFPENGWSLHGLARSLAAQGRREEAEAVERRFAAAWESADVQLAAVVEQGGGS